MLLLHRYSDGSLRVAPRRRNQQFLLSLSITTWKLSTMRSLSGTIGHRSSNFVMRCFSRAFALGVLYQSATAILVATDSPCDSKCGNVLSSTSTSDLVCKDTDYSTSSGVVWQSCLTCESTSSYYTQTDGTNYTDLQSMLCMCRHMRYMRDMANGYRLPRQYALCYIDMFVQ